MDDEEMVEIWRRMDEIRGELLIWKGRDEEEVEVLMEEVKMLRNEWNKEVDKVIEKGTGQDLLFR